jgi:hypothetical protein
MSGNLLQAAFQRRRQANTKYNSIIYFIAIYRQSALVDRIVLPSADVPTSCAWYGT